MHILKNKTGQWEYRTDGNILTGGRYADDIFTNGHTEIIIKERPYWMFRKLFIFDDGKMIYKGRLEFSKYKNEIKDIEDNAIFCKSRSIKDEIDDIYKK